MKKIFSTLLIVSFLFPFFVSGQGWIKHLTGPGGVSSRTNNIVKTLDGHYIFPVYASDGLGSGYDTGSYLIKIDEAGNYLWIHKFSDEFVRADNFILTADGGYLISNNNESSFLKLDSNGNEEWSQEYLWSTSNDNNKIAEIIATSDGGYFILGHVKSNNDILFARKVDANLNEIWTYNKENDVVTGFGVIEHSQGGFTITLENLDASNLSERHAIIHLDENGNEQWLTPISNYASADGKLKPYEFPNGEYIIYSLEAYSHKKMFKLDADGNLITEKNANHAGAFWSFTPANDGFFMIGDNNDPNLGTVTYLSKFDMDGNFLWKRQFNEDLAWLESGRNIIATDDNGLIGVAFYGQLYIFKTDSLGYIYPNKILGKVAVDTQPNCLIDSDEPEITNWVISAVGVNQTYNTTSDELGNYVLSIDTGDYVVSIIPPNNLWTPCENDINISLAAYDSIYQDFPMEATVDCPLLRVSGGLARARPCFDNRYTVYYCNDGTNTAEDAYLEIEVDSSLSYINSNHPLSSQNNNIYTFDLSDISVGECGSFFVDFFLDCNTVIGETVCIESHIYPDSFCVTDPNWNGAFVEVSAKCKDTEVEFYLENIGTADMPVENEFAIVEDIVLVIMSNFQLLTGQIDSVSVPNNGSSFALIAEQVENAPGDVFPTAWMEGCGTNTSGVFSLGFINQFSLGDNTPFEDVDCLEASNSFDPNDKRGFPLGYLDEHYIRPNTDIEYMIRFQNTGTDTAFTVVIKDEISELLDLGSVRVGAASHPYEWTIVDGNTLEFTFNNIMLPDSNANEAASHGFIEFKISQQEDLPLETVIKNEAAIYFDFNDPIITNESFHTIGFDFITVSTQNPISETTSFKVRPNPFQHQAIFELENMETTDGLFELYDISGRLSWQQKFSGKQFELKRNNLKSGMYFYKISDKGNIINSGKIIVD